jgi:hypothetical protein
MSRTTETQPWGPNHQHLETTPTRHPYLKLLGWWLAAMYAHGIVDPTGANPVFWSIQVVVLGWLARLLFRAIRNEDIPIHWLLNLAERFRDTLTTPSARAHRHKRAHRQNQPHLTAADARAHSLSQGAGAYLGISQNGKWITANRESAVMVLGPPRSGKTSAVIIPALLAAPGPAISTSTKQDVLAATLQARADLGQAWLFDSAGGHQQTDENVRRLRWSPVAGAKTWDQALLTAKAMTTATKPKRSPRSSACPSPAWPNS